MQKGFWTLIGLIALSGTSFSEASLWHAPGSSAPKATKRNVVFETHGYQRTDPYYWLKDRSNPEVLQHLEAENVFTEKNLSAKMEKTLFSEMKKRTDENEISLPQRLGTWDYFYRHFQGREHPLYYRKKRGSSKKPELLLDLNAIARKTGFADCPHPAVSPNGRFLAYACDLEGEQTFTIKVKNLLTGQVFPFEIEDTGSTVIWAADSQTLFFTSQDEVTLRSNQVHRFHLFESKKSEVIYSEDDASFSLSLRQSANHKFIFVDCISTTTRSAFYLSSRRPTDPLVEFQPRIAGLEYQVFDGDTEFFILTNWKATNNRIMRTPAGQTSIRHWQEFIPYNSSVYTTDLVVLRDFVITDVYDNGLHSFEATDRQNPRRHWTIRPTNPLAYLSMSDDQSYTARTLHFTEESLTDPSQLTIYDLRSQKVKERKTKKVPHFDSSRYQSFREWAKARDGAQVPLTVLKQRTQKLDGTAPTLLVGYGAYGTIDELRFGPEIFSLVDRGFVVVYAHIRGGGLLGRDWHNQGRKHFKINTFHDFIDSTEHLIAARIADPKRIFAHGMSAGGLLIGGIVNMRPELYRAVIAEVPFVDVLTTMLDDSIPLTTSEYDEWGNPNLKTDYEDMAVYSPYDNIKSQGYPNLLVIAGWNDGQVPYWEPAKFVAKLRDHNTRNSTVLLKTHMQAGHEGPSGRYGAMKNLASYYSFLLQNAF